MQVIAALKYIASLGPMVMMPLIVLVIGLIFRQKLSDLVRSALLVGIGFAGVNVTIQFFVSSVGPVVQKMVEIWGLHTDIMGVGWPARAAATWAFPLAAIVVFVILGINILMLTLKLTKCVMVDIWSYNHYIFTAALVWYTTKNPILAVIAAGIVAAISFKLADWTTPLVEDYFGMQGVSFPTSNSVGWAPIAWLMDKIYSQIPGFRNLKADPEHIQNKFGIFGEPMLMGFIFGCLIGLMARVSPGEVAKLGMITSAALVLIPKMMQILMDGFLPFAEGIRTMLNEKFKGGDFTIGIDAALTVANPSAIAVGILMVPTTLILATVLPGNRLLPIPDIAYQAMWLAAWPVAFSKGNIVRGYVTTIIITAIMLLGATAMAEIHTQLAIAGGFQMPAGMDLISTEDAGTHFIGLIIWKLISLFS